MFRRNLFTILALASLAACGAEGESAESGLPAQPALAESGTSTPAGDTPPTVLVPASSFPLAIDTDRVTGVAMSPDGSKVAVSTQERLGAPVTLRLYDAQSGEVVATTQADVVGLNRLHWMADNRLVSADRNAVLAWRSWDGDTLEELPTVPQDATCADGPANKNTGAVYSSDGMTSMNDVLCRVDTNDGSILRSAPGALVGAERFWVLPGSGEVAVLHSPNPDVSAELLILDGNSLTPNSATEVSFSDNVRTVGSTTWVEGDGRTSRLEPGAIPVPYLSPVRASGAGTTFIYSNGSDDLVFISAVDGQEIGTMPAGMNLSPFSDWSLDDSAFVRLTVDLQVEIYRF